MRKNIVFSMLLFAVASLLPACSTLQPVSASRNVRGIPANQVGLIVPKPVIGRMQDLRMDMADSLCLPMLADAKGVYFESLKPVTVRSWVVINPIATGGGIYVPDDSTINCKPYYVYDGMPCLVQKAQTPIEASLVDGKTKKKFPVLIQ